MAMANPYFGVENTTSSKDVHFPLLCLYGLWVEITSICHSEAIPAQELLIHIRINPMDVSPICTSSYQNLDIKSPKEADQKAGNRVRSFIGTALDHDAKKTPGMAEAC